MRILGCPQTRLRASGPSTARIGPPTTRGALISIRLRRCRRSLLLSAVTFAGLALGPQTTGTAFGATAPLSDAHEVVHFDIATLQQPENITLEPGGAADVTFQKSRQVAQVATSGTITVLATLPPPTTGSATASGIVRTADGTLYVNYNAGANSGIYRIPAGGGTPVLVVAMPDVKVLNGLAIDASRDTLYATDSSSGTVWKVSLKTKTASLWTQGADFQPGSTSTSSLGANGAKVHDGAVWVSNTGNGTLLRVPINKDGTAGTDTVKATGLSGIDDFTFTGRGDQVLAAQNGTNQASIVSSDGMVQTVLTAADGIENPTSVAVKGSTVYVASGAYLTRTDPNLLLARLR
jgi:sugar lactone lactonase YvrE